MRLFVLVALVWSRLVRNHTAAPDGAARGAWRSIRVTGLAARCGLGQSALRVLARRPVAGWFSGAFGWADGSGAPALRFGATSR